MANAIAGQQISATRHRRLACLMKSGLSSFFTTRFFFASGSYLRVETLMGMLTEPCSHTRESICSVQGQHAGPAVWRRQARTYTMPSRSSRVQELAAAHDTPHLDLADLFELECWPHVQVGVAALREQHLHHEEQQILLMRMRLPV